MIKLPLRIGGDLRERIERSYAEAIRQVGEAEELYVRSKLPGVLASLTRGPQDWRSEVALTASAIFKAYENPAWFKKGPGTVVRSTRPTFGRCPAVPATVPDPFLNHAENPDQASTANGNPRAVLLAALFYLCNPYDIIPDRVPGTGFADDAVVLNECLRRIEQESPQIYREISALMRNRRG